MAITNNIVMPQLGLTMSEGVLSEWMVAVGDKVEAGQILFVVETDKMATEIEAPGPGEITELIAGVGETFLVGEVLAKWSGGGVAGAGGPTEKDASSDAKSAATKSSTVDEPPQPGPNLDVADKKHGARAEASPLARRIAKSEDIDLNAVIGTGTNGRIKARDIKKPPEQGTDEQIGFHGKSTRSSPTALESTIARRLSEAKRDIPHFYLAVEADAGPMLAARQQLNADQSGYRLSINHFCLAAVARAWVDHPLANRVWDNGEFLSFSGIDVGLAVDTSRGLFAPVIRNAGALSLNEIARAADGLAKGARDGRLHRDALTGGAVTVSNVGRHAVTYLTPIVNPGQSAILGVGRIRKAFRPDENDHPVSCDEIGLVLACDHRVFNGVAAAEILGSIVSYLEQPLRLLRA